MATEAADVTSVARIKVEAEGTDQIKALAASMEALGKIAVQTGKQLAAVQAGGGGKPAPTPPAPKVPPSTIKSINEIFTPIGAAIRSGLKLPFEAFKAAVTAAGPVFVSITEMFGHFFKSLTQWVASF